MTNMEQETELQAVTYPVSPLTGTVTLEVIASVRSVEAAKAVNRLLGELEWQVRAPLYEYWEPYELGGK